MSLAEVLASLRAKNPKKKYRVVLFRCGDGERRNLVQEKSKGKLWKDTVLLTDAIPCVND